MRRSSSISSPCTKQSCLLSVTRFLAALHWSDRLGALTQHHLRLALRPPASFPSFTSPRHIPALLGKEVRLLLFFAFRGLHRWRAKWQIFVTKLWGPTPWWERQRLCFLLRQTVLDADRDRLRSTPCICEFSHIQLTSSAGLRTEHLHHVHLSQHHIRIPTRHRSLLIRFRTERRNEPGDRARP